MLRFLSAGESHGKALTGIIEGMVSNLPVKKEDIDRQLARRQKGYGRGKRMDIESDSADILSGIRDGKTTGAPISFLIKNADFVNWTGIMDVSKKTSGGERFLPRPGHADLPGIIKYGFDDIRNVIERSSARETAVRVAAGAVCRKLLNEFGIEIYSRVIRIGRVKDESYCKEITVEAYNNEIENSEVRSFLKTEEMKSEIDEAKSSGESLGGVFELLIKGVCPGLGSYVQWDRRLDGIIAASLMSVPAVKGVEIGDGFGGVHLPGSRFHDGILSGEKGIYRETNRAGGIEGGVSNGEDIWLKCAVKPIPTLMNPLESFDIRTMKPEKSFYERSDTCAVVPASVVGENFIALVLAGTFLEKFGGDSLEEVKNNYATYLKSIGKYWKK